jgi:hypothetical protein
VNIILLSVDVVSFATAARRHKDIRWRLPHCLYLSGQYVQCNYLAHKLVY